MRDSDDEDDEHERENDYQSNLAGFMFGNIDENGELENDILDSDAKKYLGSLCQLGLKSFLNEIISQENDERTQDLISCINNQDMIFDDQSIKSDESQDNFKLPSALDFSDINELAEDYTEERGNFCESN